VRERTRIVNRIKSTLARLGIRNFKPTMRKAAERLATVHTPEGMPLPPNTLDRPALHDALEFARSGDTLIVWKLDRLAAALLRNRRFADSPLEGAVSSEPVSAILPW
jgi:transposase